MPACNCTGQCKLPPYTCSGYSPETTERFFPDSSCRCDNCKCNTTKDDDDSKISINNKTTS